MKRTLRVAVLLHPSLVPPETLDGLSEQQWYEYKTEYDVVSTLRELGHDVRVLPLSGEIDSLRALIRDWKPHIAWNLLEEFRGRQDLDWPIAGLLDLLEVPYTGCGPRGLILARDKAMSKKLLAYDGIRVPKFAVFPIGQRVARPKDLGFPLIVKSLVQEASLGISQKSIVNSDETLRERVAFIHRNNGSDAIAEQYIAGRELNVGILGNTKVDVLPVWELQFREMPPGARWIATANVKHNRAYQRKHSIYQGHADDLADVLREHIVRTTKQIARTLDLDGFSRIDYRLDAEGTLYFLEANPNPDVARTEELASAARKGGIAYPDLIQKILDLGMRRGGRPPS
jgi:D-alanine-D-alanine ligase